MPEKEGMSEETQADVMGSGKRGKWEKREFVVIKNRIP